MNALQQRWFYERHTPQQLAAWATRLHRFRFCRAFGGHENDGDALRLHLRIDDPAEGLAIVTALGAAPGWTHVAGEPLFLWIGSGRLEASVQDPDDIWSVTEAAVLAAERLEPVFAPWDAQRIDPPVDDWHCVAPGTHPELFG